MNISITPDGAVLKDGEEIGNIVSGKCVLNKRPGPTVYKAIKDAADDQALTFDILPENPPLSSGSVVVGGKQEEAAPGTLHPSAAPSIPEIKKLDLIASLASFAGAQGEATGLAGDPISPPPASTSSTPEPRRSPALGDKDPAWQRWFVETHGEAAFKARFPTRKLPR